MAIIGMHAQSVLRVTIGYEPDKGVILGGKATVNLHN